MAFITYELDRHQEVVSDAENKLLMDRLRRGTAVDDTKGCR